jgi:beta-glucanase (GH16 family)
MIMIEPPSTSPIPASIRSGLMRRHTCVCLFSIAVGTTLAAQSRLAPNSNWSLTWSDEFSGPNGSSPDSAKWASETGGKGFGNNELETYTNRAVNAHQEDGHLVITAGKEDLSGPDGTPRHYTSARLNTIFPQKMLVDYVRVYQPVSSAAPTPKSIQ